MQIILLKCLQKIIILKILQFAVFRANVKNLKKFKIKELKKLDNAVIKKKLNPTSINYISRSLDVPRETIRRNIYYLVENNDLIRNDKGLLYLKIG